MRGGNCRERDEGKEINGWSSDYEELKAAVISAVPEKT